MHRLLRQQFSAGQAPLSSQAVVYNFLAEPGLHVCRYYYSA